jgi:hypothetical protein
MSVEQHSTCEIYCDASSHERELVDVYMKAGPPGRWTDHWLQVQDARTADGRQLRRPEGTSVPVDEITNAYLGAGLRPNTKIRRRPNLQCRLCGLSVPAREENLIPILNTLGAAGVSCISLTGLAARLHN